MATLQLGLAAAPAPSHPRVTIRSSWGTTIIPLTSRASDWGGLARKWNELDRPGEKLPALVDSGGQLATDRISFTLVARDANGNVDPDGSVEPTMLELAAHAAAGRVVIGGFSPLEGGDWVITDLALAAVERREDNVITQATGTLDLKRPSDLPMPSGPRRSGQSAGQRTKLPQPGALDGLNSWTVKPDDTLSGIASATYGDSNWLPIAAANGISDPRQLTPGTVLTLP